MIPSVFDLIGTALAKCGLLFVTVSVYQLVRCTVIIITAILKANVLKHPLKGYMWAGVMINLVAMILVSATTLFGSSTEEQPGASNPQLGIMFILASCLVQGTQYIFEEWVMADVEINAAPLVVVGFEGLWGTLLMIFVIFPWAYIIPGSDNGSLENVYDSWVMAQNSEAAQYLLWGFFCYGRWLQCL